MTIEHLVSAGLSFAIIVFGFLHKAAWAEIGRLREVVDKHHSEVHLKIAEEMGVLKEHTKNCERAKP